MISKKGCCVPLVIIYKYVARSAGLLLGALCVECEGLELADLVEDQKKRYL